MARRSGAKTEGRGVQGGLSGMESRFYRAANGFAKTPAVVKPVDRMGFVLKVKERSTLLNSNVIGTRTLDSLPAPRQAAKAS